ncbi:MAG: hypothetical protein ACREJC_21435, partial [Tepidisphaeraceae bacterium]
MSLRAYVKERLARGVRPWAMLAPVAVLVLCVPMLRPLRHPDSIAHDEALRLATLASLARGDGLALDASRLTDHSGTVLVNGELYSRQPPMLALLLTPGAKILRAMGIGRDQGGALYEYVLTLLATTLPVAGAAGLLYRMNRLFELPRPWRAGLALATVASSGLLTYAVVLNPEAPAAVLLICAAACLIHVIISKLPRRGLLWMFIAGVCAALAATLNPPGALLSVLFIIVILTMPFSMSRRLAGVALFLLGAVAPIALHVAWTVPVRGTWVPHWAAPVNPPVIRVAPPATQPTDFEPEDATSTRRLVITVAYMQWLLAAAIGPHGILVHFPVVLVGLAGVGAVMHRHWPLSVKSLAAACT